MDDPGENQAHARCRLDTLQRRFIVHHELSGHPTLEQRNSTNHPSPDPRCAWCADDHDPGANAGDSSDTFESVRVGPRVGRASSGTATKLVGAETTSTATSPGVLSSAGTRPDPGLGLDGALMLERLSRIQPLLLRFLASRQMRNRRQPPRRQRRELPTRGPAIDTSL